MIIGLHALIYSADPEADRAFLRDKLGFKHVDAGHGWLIFAMPPAELAVHPAEEPAHELYLMCDDLDATLASLGEQGVELPGEPVQARFGRLARIRLPGGGELGIYQPSHPTALDL